MRGEDSRSGSLFSYFDLEARVPSGHPLRRIRSIVDAVLNDLSGDFSSAYSRMGRPSIAPEKLLRALLLQAFYSIRSERQLMERLNFDLLFRWFVGLGIDDRVWDASSFAKNRERLLAADIAAKFLAGIVAHPEVLRLLSREHFSVDGTLVDAWASMKSFQSKDQDDDTHPNAGGRNADKDFRGQKRSNQTHASTTDPDARLYRKGAGKPAQLCYMGHVLMENRSGLAVAASLTPATGLAEREATLAMLDATRDRIAPGATLGADKAYDVWRFKQSLKERGLIPHMARRRETGWGGLPIPKPPGYDLSQRHRKRVEEVFGWVKTVGCQAKTKFRGHQRVAQAFTFAIAAYNLVRLPKLLAGAPT